MTVQPLDVPFAPGVDRPDIAAPVSGPLDPRSLDARSPAPSPGAFAGLIAGALDGARAQLERAGAAEAAFASGSGTLQAMVIERAQADVALALATSAASRVTQSLSTILGMQV